MGFSDSDYHRKKREELWEQLEQQAETKREIILRLADEYKWQIENKEIEAEYKEIAQLINKEIEKRDLGISNDWVWRTLDKECKRPREDDDDKGKLINQLTAIVEKPVSEMTESEIKETYHSASENAKEYNRRKNAANDKVKETLEEARKRNMNLLEMVTEPVKSTPKNPKETKSYHAMVRLTELLSTITTKIYTMPPDDPKADDEIAEEILKLTLYLRPLADEKWTDSLIQWMATQQTNIENGKHAAATIMKTITIDGVERDLTREQTGDRFDPLLTMACLITGRKKPKREDFYEEKENVIIVTPEGKEQYENACAPIFKEAEEIGKKIPWLYALSVLWHKRWASPRIAQRKVDLHDRFSNAA